MNTTNLSPEFEPGARGHGTCWAAILAGAAAAASLSLVLLVLGVGLGLSTVSPWSNEGMPAEALGISTIVWLTFTQFAASAVGGYLAGRLRTRWSPLHADEVYFRDTAHGFLAWSIATLATAALLTSAVGTVVSAGAKGAGVAATGAATAAAAAAAPAAAGMRGAPDAATSYFVDGLFRRTPAEGAAAPTGSTGSATATATAGATAPAGNDNDTRRSAEAARIFANAAANQALPPDDATYLAQLVSERTGLPQAEAQRRVTDGFARMQARAAAVKEEAKAAADKARKASAGVALWGFISLLIGAFIASFVATMGGRHRDQY